MWMAPLGSQRGGGPVRLPSEGRSPVRWRVVQLEGGERAQVGRATHKLFETIRVVRVSVGKTCGTLQVCRAKGVGTGPTAAIEHGGLSKKQIRKRRCSWRAVRKLTTTITTRSTPTHVSKVHVEWAKAQALDSGKATNVRNIGFVALVRR